MFFWAEIRISWKESSNIFADIRFRYIEMFKSIIWQSKFLLFFSFFQKYFRIIYFHWPIHVFLQCSGLKYFIYEKSVCPSLSVSLLCLAISLSLAVINSLQVSLPHVRIKWWPVQVPIPVLLKGGSVTSGFYASCQSTFHQILKLLGFFNIWLGDWPLESEDFCQEGAWSFQSN